MGSTSVRASAKDSGKLNIAIVGCGRIGVRHAKQAARVGKIVAVCDRIAERAAELASRTGARAYTDLTNMLSSEPEVDLVAVCTPNGLHAEHSRLAFRAGTHVLCEKPMALSVEACGRMIQAAEEANRRLFIVKQNRYNPPIMALRKALAEGHLGRISAVQLNGFWNRRASYYDNPWKGTRQLDGGILFTQFSHFIDLAVWLLGDLQEAAVFSHNWFHADTIEFDDDIVAAVRFRSGIIGTMHFTINAFDHNMEGSLTLFGERGTVKVGGQYLNALDYQCIDNYCIEGLESGQSPNTYGEYQGSMSNHHLVYDNVCDVLLRDGAITTSAYDGLRTVQAIELLHEAIEKGRRP